MILWLLYRLSCPASNSPRAAAQIYDADPDIEGLLLLNHGHFAFGETAKQSYDRLVEHTGKVEKWLEEKGGALAESSGFADRQMVAKAAQVLPVLRGIIGDHIAIFTGDRDQAMPVMELRAGKNVQEFLARLDLAELSGCGIATPDHVIRTKNYPLLLTRETLAGGTRAIAKAVDEFISHYTGYFEDNVARFADDPGTIKTMLSPTPNLAWIEGVGVVGISADGKAASAAADLAEQNIVAMSWAQQCGGFSSLG